MIFKIFHRWTAAVLFECEVDDNEQFKMRVAVQLAVKARADLHGADLSGANLSGADLHGANLRDAYLRDANLIGANLHGANLRDANLHGADLRDAYLSGANLSDADLHGADLRDADLRDADLRDADLHGADLRDADLHGADLRDANLRDADLHGADLTPVRDDFWAVLSSAPAEVMGLRTALVEGRVAGSNYEGECACLVGTIANLRGCEYTKIPNLVPDSRRPAEVWFLMIGKGATPENNAAAKQAVAWIDAWPPLAFIAPPPIKQTAEQPVA